MTLVAGVDSSTQSCKVMIRDAETGALVRTGRAAHPDGTEVDPRHWWDAVEAALVEAGGLDGVAAIAVGGQQHGMVTLDADGHVVRDALLWNDTRSAGAAADLVSELGDGDPVRGAAAWAQAIGSVPVASFTLTKLRWLRDAEPDNAARVEAVALPHAWLTWRLGGYGPTGADSPRGPDLAALTTDRSDVSGTGYWSPFSESYRPDLLTMGFGREVGLPRVLGPCETAAEAGGRLLGPGAGDNAAAALGLGMSAGDVAISIGTSGVVSAISARPTADASGMVTGFADATGAYLRLAGTLNASRVLDAAARILGVDHAGLSRLALSAPGGAERASRLRSAWSTPRIRAAASRTREALRVQASGRYAPVASAKPVTIPEASAVGRAEMADTTPEVPIEIATSPALMPRPRAAAALSPAPGPRRRPPASAAVSHGPGTRGRPTSRPKPIVSRSGRYDSENGDQ